MTTVREPKKIFFDFDGVLVRSRSVDKTFLWQKNLEHDLKISSGMTKLIFRQPEWNEILSGKIDFRFKIETLFSQHALSISADEFIEYWLKHDLHWRDDILHLASRLKKAGHSIFIATNQDQIRSSHIRKQKVISKQFDNVFSSYDLGVTKPNPEFYQRIQNQILPAKPSDCVLIDDDVRNIQSAMSLGWQGLHFNPDLEETHSVESLDVFN